MTYDEIQYIVDSQKPMLDSLFCDKVQLFYPTLYSACEIEPRPVEILSLERHELLMKRDGEIRNRTTTTFKLQQPFEDTGSSKSHPNAYAISSNIEKLSKFGKKFNEYRTTIEDTNHNISEWYYNFHYIYLSDNKHLHELWLL